MLRLDGLRVRVEDREILKGADLEVQRGQVHLIIGPNGSGKSTLALAVAGHPAYEVVGGRIFFEGEDITPTPPDERARRGLFLAFQNPVEIDGLNMADYLAKLIEKRTGEKPLTPLREHVEEFVMEKLGPYMEALGFDEGFLSREVNVGFSGGEKKKFEILQMFALRPKLAILDEPDSGVDVDSLNVIGRLLSRALQEGITLLLITHTGGLYRHLRVDRVHVMYDGRIVASGGSELFERIQESGFEVVMR